jgi:adenosine deaminase
MYETISGAYRVNNTVLLEPGFNPIYRNRGGEQDLDHIILAALRGMEKALIEFPAVRAGVILFLDRRLPYDINKIIVEKAIKYRNRGIIGVDIAGPHKEGFYYKDYGSLFAEAQEAGLKTSVHTGEDGTPEEMDHVLDVLSLDRINHGIKSAESEELMEKVKKKNLTLCICPTSNLSVGFVKDIAHLRYIVQTLYRNSVRFCINTDNPIMLKTNMKKEIHLIRENDILTEEEIDQTVQWAFDASFIPEQIRKGQDNLYL